MNRAHDLALGGQDRHAAVTVAVGAGLDLGLLDFTDAVDDVLGFVETGLAGEADTFHFDLAVGEDGEDGFGHF